MAFSASEEDPSNSDHKQKLGKVLDEIIEEVYETYGNSDDEEPGAEENK